MKLDSNVKIKPKYWNLIPWASHQTATALYPNIIATKESMKFIKTKKLTWDIDRSARYLSSWLYFWPVSYDHAKKQLEKIWRES